MPAFNAGQTIARVIESFRRQTFTDWELVAVDDGSTDSTPAILDEFAKTDSRIRVIHKHNEGVACARQTGIENATGEYSIHADSDDWVEPDMLEKMYAAAKKADADIVIADFFINHPDGRQDIRRQKLDSSKTDDIIYQLYAKDLFGGLWHKLVRATIYDKDNIRFEPGIDFCEDKLILTKILYSCPDLKITYLPEAFYHYLQTPVSITRSVSPKAFESMKRFHLAFPGYLPDQPRFKEVLDIESLQLFLSGFIYRIIPEDKLPAEFTKVKRQAYKTKSLRWLAGYICIDLHLYNLAHKFIRY